MGVCGKCPGFCKWDKERRRGLKREYEQAANACYATVRQILGAVRCVFCKRGVCWEGMPECFACILNRYGGLAPRPAFAKVIGMPGDMLRICYCDPIEKVRKSAKKRYCREYHFRDGELVCRFLAGGCDERIRDAFGEVESATLEDDLRVEEAVRVTLPGIDVPAFRAWHPKEKKEQCCQGIAASLWKIRRGGGSRPADSQFQATGGNARAAPVFCPFLTTAQCPGLRGCGPRSGT